MTAAGTRHGSSGQPWRGIDISATGQHWKFKIETLDQLDADGRIYWPPGGKGFPQIKRYRDELKGLAVGDIWTDIDKLNPKAAERLGYPTQKPEALLERIIGDRHQPHRREHHRPPHEAHTGRAVAEANRASVNR